MAKLTDDDKAYLRALGKWFYGREPRTVTPELGETLGKMLAASRKASRAMNWVPRPTGTPPGLSWVLKQAVKAAWRSHTGGGRRSYEVVRRTVALKWRSQYEMAQMGL